MQLPGEGEGGWGGGHGDPSSFVWKPESVGRGVGTSQSTERHHYGAVLSGQAGGSPGGLQLALKGFELRNLGGICIQFQ